MLMVIFGAGASYDSAPAYPAGIAGRMLDRLPLANELFENRPEFVSDLDRFPRCKAIIPYLRNPLEDRSIEQELERIQTEAEKFPVRHQQLAAIRYYLHLVIWSCEERWKNVHREITNYRTLLDQIEHCRKENEQVCIVTFNYDRMLEDALSSLGLKFRYLPDYVGQKHYKVIKLHGSVNWARKVFTPIENLDNRPVWEVVNEMIDNAETLKISDKFRIVHEGPPIARSKECPLFPALAIPVENKRNFECPSEHLQALEVCIPGLTRLLVIGWRGSEYNFLKMLAEGLQENPRVLVVGGEVRRCAGDNQKA